MAGFGDMPNFAYFMPYFKWLHFCSTDTTYFNVTLPQTGTEHQNKNVFDEHVYAWKINTINCIFISTIWNFRLWGQQSLPIKQTSKIKMASLVKRPCFTLNGQNNLWGCFHQRKRMFFSIKASGFLLQNLMNTKTSLINGCLSCILPLRSSTVSLVQAL